MMTKNRFFLAQYSYHPMNLKKASISLVSCPVVINDIHSTKVVNALWNGYLIQKNNENNEVECKLSSYPRSVYVQTYFIRCSILSNS